MSVLSLLVWLSGCKSITLYLYMNSGLTTGTSCQGRWTLYFDPGVSLVITCIIFSSALPLVKSASYILMQGVPSHVSLDAVRQCIYEVPGVDSVHELHIWQLSESTVVASVHVMIEAGRDYMVVASGIRERMHSHGIHSVTIQPE